MNKSITPVQTAEPVDIGTHGYVRGTLFYLGLRWKRVKGKNCVRGPRKDHYSSAQLGRYTPAEWKEIKKEEREKQNKKVA